MARRGISLDASPVTAKLVPMASFADDDGPTNGRSTVGERPRLCPAASQPCRAAIVSRRGAQLVQTRTGRRETLPTPYAPFGFED